MKLEHAELIVKTGQLAGLSLCVHEDRLNTKIFGETTAGVSGQLSDIVLALILVTKQLTINYNYDQLQSFVSSMRLSFDSIGRDMIAY